MDNPKRIIKRIITALIVTISLYSCSKESSLPYWMIGNWQTQSDGFTIIENWKLDNNQLKGATSWIKGTVHFEEKSTISTSKKGLSLKILIRKRTIVFKSEAINSDTLVFINAKNDFPKRICYTLLSNDKLIAWIENYPNDPKKKVFSHKRIVNTEH
jgi:hypothetical protein